MNFSVCSTCGHWKSATRAPCFCYEAITSAGTSQNTSPSNRSVSWFYFDNRHVVSGVFVSFACLYVIHLQRNWPPAGCVSIERSKLSVWLVNFPTLCVFNLRIFVDWHRQNQVFGTCLRCLHGGVRLSAVGRSYESAVSLCSRRTFTRDPFSWWHTEGASVVRSTCSLTLSLSSN